VRVLCDRLGCRRQRPGHAPIAACVRRAGAQATRPEPGHALVLPVAHVRSLHDAEPDLRDEVFAVTATLTGAFPALFGAVGSYVFLNIVEPDGQPFHLHVHAVPRFAGDGFREPDPAVAEVPRDERLAQAAVLRGLLA
jgi:histidine triad (HIT) family protein